MAVRKVPLVIHRANRMAKVGELVIDDYNSLTFTITDPDIVANMTESKSDSFTALVFDSVID